MRHAIDPSTFLDVARPHLAATDAQGLAAAVRERWTSEQVCSLLFHPNPDVRRVAAVVVGLVGDLQDAYALARALWDGDEQVNQMAEHGLWSIWFRGCTPEACRPFREGVALLGVESFDRAVLRFQDAVRLDPRFGEAHNQCAIAYYFMGDWKSAVAASGRAVAIIPIHFGAIASLGHCYAQLGDLDKALRCYRKALRVNPRMPAISRAIRRLEGALTDPKKKEDSGEFLLDQILA